jgi:hypothetical protein
MQIRKASEYRAAVNQVQRLSRAAPGSPQFRRRHTLLAAMAAYEQRKERPEWTPGKPAPFSIGTRKPPH